MFNQDPEMSAYINKDNVQKDQDDADNKGNQGVIDEDQNEMLEEFNYNGKLGNNNNGLEGNDIGNYLL